MAPVHPLRGTGPWEWAELGTVLGAEATAGRTAALSSGSTEWERVEAEARGLVYLGTRVGTSLTEAEHL